jgi:murein lipoprotein
MEKKSVTRFMTAGALVALVGLAGCASTSDLDKLRAEVHDAATAASDAKATADAAKQEAAAASSTAADAKTTADEAKAMSEATDAKLDRMFKKAMYK